MTNREIDEKTTPYPNEEAVTARSPRLVPGGILAQLSGAGLPSVASAIMGSMAGTLGAILKYGVLAAVWILLASSSFTFGMDFIGPWLFRGYLGDAPSRFVSGVACFILFDLAYTSSLTSFFRGAKSNAQRALYLVFFVVPFVLGLVASISGFMLITDSNVVLSQAQVGNVAALGRMAIYAGIVNLALYGILPNALDPHNVKQMLSSMIESSREARKQTAWLLMEQESEREYFRTVQEAAAELGRAHGAADVTEFRRYWGQRIADPVAPPLQIPQRDDDVWIIPVEEAAEPSQSRAEDPAQDPAQEEVPKSYALQAQEPDGRWRDLGTETTGERGDLWSVYEEMKTTSQRPLRFVERRAGEEDVMDVFRPTAAVGVNGHSQN